LDLFGAKWAEIQYNQLNDGSAVAVREAIAADIPRIREYIDQLSPDDRYLRYMSSISIDALKDGDRLERIYKTSLEAEFGRRHVAFVVERGAHILGVVHAWEREVYSAVYELSYSRRSDHEGCGVGGILMNTILDWARASGVRTLVADTLRENHRMRKLFQISGFQEGKNPDDPSVVHYTRIVTPSS